ncbi:hypothetical protein JST97_20280 [bacterium]|nr:hypothetical protein [bacterium]
MCIFTGHVDVGATKIFAAPKADGGQYLLYQMVSSSATSVAMILPIPVPPGTPETSVRFLDLKFWPEFFQELATIFPRQPQDLSLRKRLLAPFLKGDRRKLEVFEVGDYVASFVPSLGDFSRLDDQFRLPQTTWDQLPGYSEFGFAVFQFASGTHRMHPVAFEFPRRDPKNLFFPTVHVHDGRVHSQARFDHALYCQTNLAPPGWECSVGVPCDMGGDVFQLERWDESYRPFLDLYSPVYRRKMRGTFANRDVVVGGEV